MLLDVVKLVENMQGYNLVSDLMDFITAQAENPPERTPGWHPSEFASDWFCLRKAVIRSVMADYGVEEDKSNTANMQLIFQLGHCLHDWYRDKYLGPMGVLHGTWECLNASCNETINGKMPEKCSLCGSQFTYKEDTIQCDTTGITGALDGYILGNDGKVYVIDLKTMKPESWDILQKPLKGNVRQLMVYMHKKDIEQGILLYINKSTGRVKQFIVRYSKSMYEQIIDETISETSRAIENQKLPRMASKCGANSWMRHSCKLRKYCEGYRTWNKMEAAVKADVVV